MPAPPAMSAPPISPGEMQLLLSRAGLVLNPGQVADLVLAWRQVAGLIASIPHDRPLADDAAYAFHLPSPAGVAAAAVPARVPAKPAAKARPSRQAAAPRARPAVKAKPKGKAKAKPKAPAKPKAAAKRKAARPVPRKPTKSARRRR
jgi:hypothetical protein